MVICLGAYLWVLTSGKDQFILDQGKVLYQSAVKWLDGADADFQLKDIKSKKKSRRWD
jgi:hypothetical protein